MSEQDERDEQIWGEQPPRDGIEQYAREADPFYSGAAASAGADPEPRMKAIHEFESAILTWTNPKDAGHVLNAIARLKYFIEAEARAQGGPSLDVPAMTETLRFLYHAEQPCDKPDEHRHEWIAMGIVGQYPRLAARLGVAPEPPEVGE